MAKARRKTIDTVDGPRSVLVHEAHRFDPDEFYAKHRGGSGSVIIVMAINKNAERMGVFGSIETAQLWALEFGDDWHCIFSPYVVDEPGFGNETKQ